MDQTNKEIINLKSNISENNSRKAQCRKEIASKTKAIDQYEKLVISIQKKSENQQENLLKKIEQEIVLSHALLNEVDSLNDALRQQRAVENANRRKLESSLSDTELLINTLKRLNDEKNRELNRIDEFNIQMRESVPYGRLKTAICPKCIVKIKHRFSDELLYGLTTVGSDSMIESILAAGRNSKKAMSAPVIQPPMEACKCIIS